MRTIIRRSQTGISVTKLWELQQEGLYPAFFRPYGGKAAAIFEDEHDRVMALRAAGASNDEVRKLVESIHQERQQAAEVLLAKEVQHGTH